MATDVEWMTFVSGVVSSVAWPLAALIALLAFRSQLGRLVLRISKFKYGDAEFEFSKALLEAEKNAPAGGTPIAYAGPQKDFSTLAEASPRAAVLESWLLVENQLRELAQVNDMVAGTAPNRMMMELARREALDVQSVNLVAQLRNLRNKIVHESDHSISPREAREYAELALRAADVLRTKMDK